MAPLDALLARLPVAAYTCEPGGLLTAVNPVAAGLWGQSPKLRDPADRYCGSWRLLTPAGDPVPHDRCWMARALHDDAPYNARPIRVARPDGRVVDALAFANPLHDAGGGLVGGVNVMVDVTADRQAEAAIGRAVAELRERSEARAVGLLTALVGVAGPLAAAHAGLVPMCAHCKAVRDGSGAWGPVEEHLRERHGETVTHGICPGCVRQHFGDYLPADG